MRNGMYIGLAAGMVIGALITCNNRKVRHMVDDAQDKIRSKMKKQGEEMVKNTCECACETFCGDETVSDNHNTQQQF